MICYQLCPSDVPRFASIYSTPILTSNTISDSDLIRCYSPYHNKMFIVRTPLRVPSESRIFSGDANGCVTLTTPDKTLLFGNLLDISAFETTESKHDEGYFCASHKDGTGNSEQCAIFGFYASTNTIRVQRWNGERWKYFVDVSDDEGLWYCLGKGGRLGVYGPKRRGSWIFLHKPTSFGSEFPHKNGYLEMMWEKIDSLGSRAIFTGTVASLSMAKPPKDMENKVYLPKFYGHPPIYTAKLTSPRDRLFFVPEQKEMQQPSSNKSFNTFMGKHGTCGDKNGAWCYDLELDSRVDKKICGCKNMLQYIWVHLGRASP
uniref:DUF295 domain-containing protein n=1 Tax=Setaria viridis TaxID=4556 RepID=A0A4U6VJI9_SETVI|nr:hypothetical protein SEVIR_3G307600v2 [Setaria viridis]